MDPYLERHWRGVHANLVIRAQDALNVVLPRDLAARTEDRVYVETEGVLTRVIAPDVRVVEHPHPHERTEDSAVAVAEPLLLELDAEPTTERFIEIIESDGGRVVTAIEFVSPANKTSGAGKDAYLKKRQEFRDSNSHLVEIDLIRGGDWLELIRPYRVPPEYRSTYRVFIRRADREKGELYPISLRERLPRIAIPLRATDQDVVLDLQALLDRTYESGRYDLIDYSGPCEPPLEGEEARWLAERLAQDRG
jgi:hypothetical protein